MNNSDVEQLTSLIYRAKQSELLAFIALLEDARSARSIAANEAANPAAPMSKEGDLSAAIEVRRLFPGITDHAEALSCARTIAGWKPLPAPACQPVTPSEEPGSADEALIGSSRRELPLAETAYSSAVPPKGIPGFRREEVERIGHPASLRLFPWPTKPIFLPSGPAVPWGSACCAPWALNTGR